LIVTEPIRQLIKSSKEQIENGNFKSNQSVKGEAKL
jgi:hypothetical protein